MNNKGQTLALFAILLPIILILLIILINYGMISVQKIKAENSIKEAIEYGLKLKINQELEGEDISNSYIDSKIKCLLKKNINYDTLNIKINSNSILITAIINNNGFIKILNNSQINLSYSGKIENGKIIIEGR